MQNTKAYLKITLMAAPLLILSACGYNPNTSIPSPAQECVGLQRQILFSQDNNTLNTNGWQQASQARLLQNEYNSKHCYRILREAKHNSHKPTKTVEQATANDTVATPQA